MKHFNAIIPLLCIGLCVLLVSCSEGGGSIYATIEVEKKIADSSLSNILTINDIVKTAANEYYIAAGGIFHGTLDTATDAITWNPNSNVAERPYNVADGLCNALAWYGGTLYGGFITTSSNLGLHKASLQTDETYSFIDSSAMTDPVVEGRQVTLLRPLNGHLFAVLAAVPSGGDSYAYDVDYLSSAVSSWSARKTGIEDKVIDVVWDGVNYWMATSSAVFKDAADPPLFAASEAKLGTYTVTGINGIFADVVKGRIFIATKSGGVYYSLNRGSTWKQIAAEKIGSATVSFLTVAGPVDTAKTKYLVGSDGYGYYTLTLTSDGKGSVTRFLDKTVALYMESVRTILVDGNTVFMGTNTDGLWRTMFDPATGARDDNSVWTHE
jgi:hypothetical protein